MKEEFFDYIGPVDNLGGYTRSYKLVFYKCFFENLGEDFTIPTEDLTRLFKEYYVNRVQSGRKPDENVDTVIENIEQSSLNAVYRLILKNPFAAISKPGFILQITRNGKEYFALNEQLQKELTAADIQHILSIVDKKLTLYFSRIDCEPELAEEGAEEPLTVKETISNIEQYIAVKGFNYPNGLIQNFYLSLKSKPFVILAGTSGTGKTRLVRLFAEALGATAENGQYKMVSVRPDWSDSSDLFGHVDLNGQFIPGAMIDFVKQAESDLQRPYFLCLDEMNLARVEYYLSDILSVMETRDKAETGAIVSDPLISETYYGADQAARKRYGTVYLPENLYIIGTVNMDETTFPFSRKVLDRANTIEFSYVDLIPDLFEPEYDIPYIEPAGNNFLKSEYLLLNQCADDWDAVTEYCTELQKINQILQHAGAHVGYRVRDEIVFYMLNNRKYELLDENEAFDYELMQKILPRIQGSSSSVKEMLCDLFQICAGDYDGYQTQSDDISSKMMKALQKTGGKYPHSAEKIAFMVRRLEEDGFTSYWL